MGPAKGHFGRGNWPTGRNVAALGALPHLPDRIALLTGVSSDSEASELAPPDLDDPPVDHVSGDVERRSRDHGTVQLDGTLNQKPPCFRA